MPDSKQKSYYDVKVTCMLPATLTYRVFAEDAQQASEIIRKLSPNSVKYKLIGRKEIKMTVFKAGECIIEFVRNLFNSGT